MKPEESKPEHGPYVTITINNEQKSIHRGHNTVIEIKTLGGIPLADDLILIVCNEMKPLSDDGEITIKGGEVFVSHPKGSSSSEYDLS
jgi:hypothetical protein